MTKLQMRSFIIVPSYDINRVIALRRNRRSRVVALMANMREISRAYITRLGKKMEGGILLGSLGEDLQGRPILKGILK